MITKLFLFCLKELVSHLKPLAKKQRSGHKWRGFPEQPEINLFLPFRLASSVWLWYKSSPLSCCVQIGWFLSPAWLYYVQVWDLSSPQLCEHADKAKTYTHVYWSIYYSAIMNWSNYLKQPDQISRVGHNASLMNINEYLSSSKTWIDFNKNLEVMNVYWEYSCSLLISDNISIRSEEISFKVI